MFNKDQNRLVADVKATKAFTEVTLRAHAGDTTIKVETISNKDLSRKVAKIQENETNKSVARAARNWWYSIWKLTAELRSDAKEARYASNALWRAMGRQRRKASYEALWASRHEAHEAMFKTFVSEANECFWDMACMKALEELNPAKIENLSMGEILRGVRKAVSATQREWSEECKWQSSNKELHAIYAAALRNINKKGYDAYCRSLARDIRAHFGVNVDAELDSMSNEIFHEDNYRAYYSSEEGLLIEDEVVTLSK